METLEELAKDQNEDVRYFPIWAFEDLKNHPNITQKALTEINEES